MTLKLHEKEKVKLYNERFTMKKETNKNIGSDFDDFLTEQGIREEVEATAI